MSFDDILRQAGELGIFERRSMNAEYCELVFFSKDLEAWHRILSSVLGEPKKPPGQEPSAADQDLTQNTGGIRINQTLFEKKIDKETVIAKFWPWGDGEHITLKMAVLFN